MRFLLALLLAFALSALPVSGVATAGASMPVACHDMPAGHDMPGGHGKACAEHCMMQAATPQTVGKLAAPAIRNAIGARRAALIDARAPRAADPPETPPPRG